MKEIHSDLWSYHRRGWLVIQTDLTVKEDGSAVMGAGMASEAARRMPILPDIYGTFIQKHGRNTPVCYEEYQKHYFILTPTKYNWRDKSPMALVTKSADQLAALYLPNDLPVYLPLIGTDSGGLFGRDVKIMLSQKLGDRFTLVNQDW